jgi:hypothetical protein
MVNCKTCNIYIGEDGRRKYCDNHRELHSDGKYRRKGYVAEFFRKKKRKYGMRQTRVTGTGFSEHLITDKKGKANFTKERIRVRKERRRIGI